MKARGIIGISGVDTRALTARIRRLGMPNAVIAHRPDGAFDRAALLAKAKAFPGIDGMDLVPDVGATQRYDWDETSWTLEDGYGHRAESANTASSPSITGSSATFCGCWPIRAAR